jgi:hypothetical protein
MATRVIPAPMVNVKKIAPAKAAFIDVNGGWTSGFGMVK